MDRIRLDRVRLLSRRFNELQGLKTALVGASIILVESGYLITTSKPTGSGAIIAILAAVASWVPGVWWLNRYYARTFGRQVAKPPPRWLSLVLFGYFVVAWSINAKFEAFPAGAPTVTTVGLISLWVAIRDWPWRAYYLGVTAAVAITFAVTTFGAAPADSGRTLTTMFLALGTSLLVVGLFDHWLLVKLMKEVRSASAATAAGDLHRG